MKRVMAGCVLMLSLVLTGCSQKAVEQRPAAECKPIAEYETYDTVTVESLDEVPTDCTSVLLTTWDLDKEKAFDYENEEQLYYYHNPLTFAVFPRLDCFAYIVKVPEEKAAETLGEAAQRPLTRLGLYGIDMKDLDALSKMSSLETLWMSDCDVKADFTGTFPALTDLQCSWSDLERLGKIPEISTLQRLSLRGTGVQSLKGLDKLTNLSKLDLECTHVRNLKPLRTMTQLTSLNLNDMGILSQRCTPDLRVLAGMVNLRSLGLNDCAYGLKYPEELSNLTALEHLSIVDSKLESTDSLEPLVNMRVLDLRANKISDISPLAGMTELETLNLHHNRLGSIDTVKEMPHLKMLAIGGNDIIDLSPVRQLHEIEYFSAYLCGNLTDITPLQSSSGLKRLDIRATNVTDTDMIAAFRQLEKLELSGTKINDMTFAAGQTQLRELDIAGTKTEDITPLFGLSRMEVLDISNTNVKDITGIGRLSNLRELKMSSTNVESIDELSRLSNLQSVNLENCRSVEREAVEALREQIEKRGGRCTVSEY